MMILDSGLLFGPPCSVKLCFKTILYICYHTDLSITSYYLTTVPIGPAEYRNSRWSLSIAHTKSMLKSKWISPYFILVFL